MSGLGRAAGAGRPCLTCGATVHDRSARWGGTCGSPLAPVGVPERRPRRRPGTPTCLLALIVTTAVIAGSGDLAAERPSSGVTDGAVVVEGARSPGDVAAERARGGSPWHPAGRVVATDAEHTLLARSGDEGATPDDATVPTGQFVLLDAHGREVWRAAGTARSTCVRRATFTETAVEVTLCHGGAVAFHRSEGFVLARGPLLPPTRSEK